ncbi:MAG: hypothetical protein AAB911_01530 [Patescibacteria group bacterium]
MDGESVRKEIMGFVGPRPLGRDILDIRKYLGSPPWHELVALLEKMDIEGLIKKEERRVEGSRLATFYMIGSRSFQTATAGTQVTFQKGEGSHDHG